MKKSWSIGDISFSTKEEYRAGQRDLKQIKKLLVGVDLDDPIEVKELYRMLRGRPFLFESEVGIAFKAYLQERSFGASGRREASRHEEYPEPQRQTRERQIRSERQIARSYKADYDYDMEQEEPQTPARRTSRQSLRLSGTQSRGSRKPSEQIAPQKKKSKKKVLVFWGVLAGIALMLFGFWQIFSYDIRSYISQKKMEELISCILVPYDAKVSEAHRIADLIASGQYTEQEAIEIAKEELARQEEPESDPNAEPTVLYQYSVLYERNPDMAGWIRLDGTILNYPVMLTPKDEEYYLKRGFDKKSDINGLPFMDVRCSITAPVSNYLIHGHNMKNGSMFSCLLQYEKQEFYEEHKQIYFDTVYETGTYEIVGVFQTAVAYVGEDTYRYYEFINAETAEEYDAYISYVKEQSFYDTGITAEFGDQLLTLSTCDRRIQDGRFVVVARKCR